MSRHNLMRFPRSHLELAEHNKRRNLSKATCHAEAKRVSVAARQRSPITWQHVSRVRLRSMPAGAGLYTARAIQSCVERSSKRAADLMQLPTSTPSMANLALTVREQEWKGFFWLLRIRGCSSSRLTSSVLKIRPSAAHFAALHAHLV